MYYCLNKRETEKLLNLKAVSRQISDDNHLKLLIENADSWIDQLACLTYLLSKILEKNLLREGCSYCDGIISTLYKLPNEMWIDLQEFDATFIKYMFGHIRSSELTLEENLLFIQKKLGEHIFG